MTPFRAELVSAGQIEDLPRIIDFIEQSCSQAGVNHGAWFDLQLAAEEACTNIIEHAYRGAGGELKLTFETRRDEVVITLHDRGRPFSPQAVAEPDLNLPLDQRPIGGLGLYLINRMMDEVRFSFTAERGNQLVMVKRGVVQAVTPE